MGPVNAEIGDEDFVVTPAPVGLADRYRRDWWKFAVWCAGAERSALPASTITVAEFLADNPAKAATQAGRLTAVNRVHELSGLPAPGRSESIRQTLDVTRARRFGQTRLRVDRLLPSIPVWGWPSGLAGRRNAAMLVLVAAGLPYAEVARLTLGDLVDGAGEIRVGSQPLVTLCAGSDPYRCPVSAVRSWLQVRPALQRVHGHDVVRSALETRTLPGIASATVDSGQPLFIRLDRYGYAPAPFVAAPGEGAVLPPLSAAAIAAIVDAHFSGQPLRYRNRRIVSTVDGGVEAFELVDTDLSDDYYERGTAARRRDAEMLDDIDERLDAVLEQMDAWMAHTDKLIDEAFG